MTIKEFMERTDEEKLKESMIYRCGACGKMMSTPGFNTGPFFVCFDCCWEKVGEIVERYPPGIHK
jgi:hypothetical protein